MSAPRPLPSRPSLQAFAKRWLSASLVLLLVGTGSGGCAASNGKDPVGDEAIWRPINALTTHPRRIVRYPSSAGAVAGGVVGVPVAVVLLPVTLPMSWLTGKKGDMDFLPLAPAFLCAQGGAILAGGTPWLLFRKIPRSKGEPR